MNDMSFRPFALDIVAEEKQAFEIAEALGLLDESPALSVSIFEVDNDRMQVQALYESEVQAKKAASALSLKSNIHQLPETDWVSETQSGLTPVIAGRFFVHGSHDKDNIPEGTKHPILIDAGMAFGTGHHGTTKGCLVIFDELLNDGFKPRSVLDLGCGAGILAIAAAMALPKTPILASDIDKDAVDVSLQNAMLNNTNQTISIFQADGFQADRLANKQFELIFANILAGPLMGLASDIFNATTPNGKVILSGILTEQAETVANTFVKAGFDVEPKITLDEWTSLLASKP